MDLTIRGVQDNGVQACAKHYIGYEQETQRSNTTTADGKNVDGYSSNIDDRTLHELYLWPFADAVRAGVASVMCSYNRLNLTYSCENSHSLNGILKGELGFRGFVMSGFFATHSGVKSVLAGLDMDMPGPTAETNLGETFFGPNIVSAVQNGSLSEARMDDMLRRILTPYYYLGQDKIIPLSTRRPSWSLLPTTVCCQSTLLRRPAETSAATMLGSSASWLLPAPCC